jgi:hypothetical protein
MIDNKIQTPERKTCFLNPAKIQYKMKARWALSKNGTSKLMIAISGKVFGAI